VNLSAHFTLAEFTATGHAVDNTLPEHLLEEAKRTAEMLEAIRSCLGDMRARIIPLIVTSGYRCPELNAAVGGAASSDHLRAMAADFKAPAFGTPLEVCRAIAPHLDDLGIGQLIHEFGTWVHVSTRRPEREVNRILTISHAGTLPGIVGVA
jgi:zinc D-Ala-D-Ala carboxypeptidase